ncbi:MAG: hypothetical protein OWS74_05765, partial [Firmicutes bacterium]|nr:hypothetical protein [Bacillota bacterium]
MAKNSDLTAIIDIGSNTMRLMIIKRLPHQQFLIIDEYKAAPRLISAIDDAGYLSAAGFSNLIDILARFRDIARAYGADPVIARATAVLREIPNGDRVAAEIFRQAGLTVEIISGEEEARLGFLAVANSFDLTGGLTIDVGGGSSEVIHFQKNRVMQAFSLPAGAVSLTMRNWPLEQIRLWVIQQWEKLGWLPDSPPQFIAMGGTARAIARAMQTANDYPLNQIHGFVIPSELLSSWLTHIAAMTAEQRRKLAKIPKERENIIIAGAAIIEGLLKQTHSPQLTISGVGLRNGLAWSSQNLSLTDIASPILIQSALTLARTSIWPESFVHALQTRVREVGED